MNIREMLDAGKTPDELRAMLEKEIKSATEAKEKEESVYMSEIRGRAVDAVVDYLIAVGVVKRDEDSTEFRTSLTNDLKELEPDLGKVRTLMETLKDLDVMLADNSITIETKSAPSKSHSDAVIERFLRNIL